MKLRIIGTSHIAQQSLEEIKAAFKSFQPEIVAVELDRERAYALKQKEQRKITLAQALRVGFKGYLFAKVGQYVQQKLGQAVGVAPGAEMKTAMELAEQEKLIIALIDQPIQVTLQNFSRNLTWKEKFRFVGDLFKGLFFKKKQMQEYGLEDFDLAKVPAAEAIDRMMLPLKKRYPNVYKTLVEDRNKYMIKKLVRLLRDHPGKRILVVVGAGHKSGMEELLLKVDVI